MRHNITVVNHYNVFPFNHGGTLYIRGLYKALSEWFDINIISFVTHDVYDAVTPISAHVKIYTIVIPEYLVEKQYDLYERYGMNDKTMIDSAPCVMEFYHTCPEIIDRVREIARNSIVVFAEHCYTWKIIKKACADKHLWYRSQNVEYDYKITTYGIIGSPQEVIEETYEIEKACCEQAERILTISKDDIDRFMELYHLPNRMKRKFLNIESGVDIDSIQPVLPSNRKKLDKDYEFCGFFISSNNENAGRAAKACVQIGVECPDIKIIIAGNVNKRIADIQIPPNVCVMGVITDEEKNRYLSSCDFALNLIESGAGVNVKMFEYFSYGIPVIATEHGARGIEVTNGKEYILTKAGRYVEDVRKLCEMNVERRDMLAWNAIELMNRRYSWRAIGKRVAMEINCLYKIPTDKTVIPVAETKLFDFHYAESFIPEEAFYIRCAGDFGLRCLRYLRSFGLEPIAFIDEDEEKQKTFIDGIRVISMKEFFQSHRQEKVIIANYNLNQIAADMIVQGLTIDKIILAYGGIRLFDPVQQKGSLPLYYNPEKIKNEILRKVRELKTENVKRW